MIVQRGIFRGYVMRRFKEHWEKEEAPRSGENYESTRTTASFAAPVSSSLPTFLASFVLFLVSQHLSFCLTRQFRGLASSSDFY